MYSKFSLRFYKAQKVLTQSIAQMYQNKKTGGSHKLETTLNLTVEERGLALAVYLGFEIPD